jgi:hypothetical protein
MRPRSFAVALALFAAAGCATLPPAPGPSRAADPAVCLRLFERYDTATWLYPNSWIGKEDASAILPAPVDRAGRLLRLNGCLTSSEDLDGMPELAARLSPHTITNSGPAIRPTPVHVGIVTGITDEAWATRFFRGLGYRSRGVGAEGLGRRLYIGPFTSQGALDEAMSIARQAGFIAPFPPKHTKF